MGCDEIKTLEIEDKEPIPKSDDPFGKKNLCLKMYSGQIQPNNDFVDSVIKNQEELEDKLRSYIPTKIKKDDSDVPVFNTRDDILTKSVNINFNEYYLIAINGVNRVLRVEEENGNYLIFHDEQPAEKNKYIALIVLQIGPQPEIFYKTPKNMI